jgi:hypothetical protein
MLIRVRFQFGFPEVLFGMLLAVAIFALGVGLWSSHQLPSNQQNATSEQTTENKGSADSPKTQSIWIPTDSVGLYTLVLAVFSGVLASVSIFQGIMLLRSDKTARIAAEAAKKSADAAINVELPILIMRFASLHCPTIPSIPAKSPLPNSLNPIIQFENYGRSPAQMVACCLEWTVAKSATDLPIAPQYKNVAPYSDSAVFLQNSRIPVDAPCQIVLTDEQATAINECEAFLWIFGFLSYRDFVGQPHEARFCIKWNPDREGKTTGAFGFVWDSETPAEYTKRT